MKVYAGIDLHSSNNYIGIINEENRRLYQKRLPNQLKDILPALEPFRETMEGVVVESTYNWYWLVDGLGTKIKEIEKAVKSHVKLRSDFEYLLTMPGIVDILGLP